MYLDGLPGSGPLGIKSTVAALNAAGFRTRRGALFGVGPLHKILTSRYYANGVYLWGVTNSRTGEANDPEKVSEIPLPSIVSQDIFDRVQAKLAANNPRTTPPRVVNGPCLLTGLAVCTCGAGMTRTGTVRHDRRYSYYTCAVHHQKGPAACKGRHVPMEKLDSLVTAALKERLFAPARLKIMLRSLADQQALRATQVTARLVALQSSADDAKARLTRLDKTIEDGVAEEDDVLRERISSLRAEQARAVAALNRAKLDSGPLINIDAERISRFGLLMRDRMDGDDVNAKRAYIASVVERIEVHDRVVGQKYTLRDAVEGKLSGVNVSGFVRRWRASQNKTANMYVIEIMI